MLFRNRELLADAGHPLPRRPLRRALPRRARPDASCRGAGWRRRRVGAWDRLAARVRDCDGTAIISHEILATASRAAGRAGRSSRSATRTPRSTSCSRCATWSARSRPSGRRTSSTGASSATATSSTRSRTRPRASRIASWFWGVQEIPDILDRWGGDLPPERVHLVTVPPPGGPPDLLWERFSAALRARRPRPRPRGRARQPVARRAGDRAAAPDQPRPTRRARPRATTGRWSASCSPTRPCRGGPARRGWRCRRTSHAWAVELSGVLGRRARATRGTTWSATSTTWSARRRPSRYADPDQPDEARGRRRRASTRSRRCCVENGPAARRPSSGCRPSSTRRDRALRAVATCGRRTGAREKVVRRLQTQPAPAAGCCAVYRRLRGRSSRSA